MNTLDAAASVAGAAHAAVITESDGSQVQKPACGVFAHPLNRNTKTKARPAAAAAPVYGDGHVHVVKYSNEPPLLHRQKLDQQEELQHFDHQELTVGPRERRSTSLAESMVRSDDRDSSLHPSIVEEARAQLQRQFAHGSAFRHGIHNIMVPKFDKKELVLGKRLGKGSFSNVDTISAIIITERQVGPPSSHSTLAGALGCGRDGGGLTTVKMKKGRLRREDTVALDDRESRQFIAQHCHRNSGEARYALKSIRKDVLSPNNNNDPHQRVMGLCDLVVESMFLSSLVHPNIIKLRAMSTADPFSGHYFLVLDRLNDTLQKRMETTWTETEKRLYSFWGRTTDRKGKRRLDFFEHRLERAFDLASAIQYLHEKKVIHRDIKPDNIGFDVRGKIRTAYTTGFFLRWLWIWTLLLLALHSRFHHPLPSF